LEGIEGKELNAHATINAVTCGIFFKDKTFILISKIICFWTKKMFKFEWAALYN
jgi:hypothetical protein